MGEHYSYYEYSLGLSSNLSINWTNELIEKYEDKIDFTAFIGNSKVIWDIEKIKKFSSKIDWDRGFILYNENIDWSDKILSFLGEKIKPYFSRAKNISWSKNFIIDNLQLINWVHLCQNESVPWNYELIKTFEKYICWDYLSANKAIKWDYRLQNQYHYKVTTFSQVHSNCFFDGEGYQFPEPSYTFGVDTKMNHELFELLLPQFSKMHSWDGLSVNVNLNWSIEFIKKNESKWNWKMLSMNPSLPWSFDFIKTFETRIDFEQLAGNKSIIWDNKIIEAFGNRIIWGTKEEEERGMICRRYGIDASPNLKITNEVIEKYSDKWNWKFLGKNPCIQWTESLFNSKKGKIDLGHNYTDVHFLNIWNTLFKPYVTKISLPEIFKKIREKEEQIPKKEQEYWDSEEEDNEEKEDSFFLDDDVDLPF